MRILCEKAHSHRDRLTADYTYLQAAQPTTFGHYLLAFAWPALRDLERLQELYQRVDFCPAGIGSANGSTILPSRRKLSERLGFHAPVRHARDAMWQGDLAIESASVAVMVAVNLDRLSEDLMIFATAEFGVVKLADRHSRASKIMPQKRNPFALSFIRALANRLLGVQTQLSATARTPSGQMDNRLFAYQAAPDALRCAADAVHLLGECVQDLTFIEERAIRALRGGSVCASDLAEHLVIDARLDHRLAHRIVGRLLTALEAEGRTFAQATVSDLHAAFQHEGAPVAGVSEKLLEEALNPAACVSARDDLGGANALEIQSMADACRSAICGAQRFIAAKRAQRNKALARLRSDAQAFLERG